MDLLQRLLHADVRNTLWIRLNDWWNGQLVNKGSKQALRGRSTKLVKRMLDMSVKRDTALRMDTGIDCLA
jgi:hypothetical protein